MLWAAASLHIHFNTIKIATMERKEKTTIETVSVDVVKGLLSLPSHCLTVMLESVEELEAKRIRLMAQKDVIGSL